MAYMPVIRRRQDASKEKALSDIFNKTDTNENGKILATDFVNIMEANDIKVDDEELAKIGELADELDFRDTLESAPVKT